MKFFPLQLAAFLVAGLVLASPTASAQTTGTPPAPSAGTVADGIAAVVGDEIILRSEVDVLVANIRQQNPSAPVPERLWMDALDELINQKVLSEQAALDTTITVSDEQLDQALDQRVQQLAAQAGGEEQLEELYGQSILELKQDFREDFRDQLLAEQLRATKLQEVDVTPSEVRAWFERIPSDSLPTLPTTVRVAHVVRYPKPSETAEQDALDIIGAIRDSIVTGGAPIEELARRYSDDPGSAREGGRIQGVQLQDLYPEFAAVASRLPIDSLSSPVRTPVGYHLIRVNSRAGSTVDFNHVLIRIDESGADPGEAIDMLTSVRDSIAQYNIPFELMARRHSEEAASSNDGGRVVAPNTGQRDLILERLGTSWQQTVDTLKVGEISQPAEVELLNGRRGYHIVLLQDRTPTHQVNIETDYTRIREYALQEKQAEVLAEWLAELREDMYVDVRVSPDEVADAGL